MTLTPSDCDSVARLLSHALRHDPASHFLEIDSDGWAPLEDVLLAIRCERSELRRFRRADLEAVISSILPRRFEIGAGRIRALYGHSLPYVETGVERIPPTILFHGTTEAAWGQISKLGLLPMGRKLVHLTDERGYAESVARAKSSDESLLIEVQAQQAFGNGHKFFQANRTIWLTGSVSAQFLKRSVFKTSVDHSQCAKVVTDNSGSTPTAYSTCPPISDNSRAQSPNDLSPLRQGSGNIVGFDQQQLLEADGVHRFESKVWMF